MLNNQQRLVCHEIQPTNQQRGILAILDYLGEKEW